MKAVYTGTFDPLTLGHLDIIKRASEIFDEVYVLISINVNKHTLFSLDERVKILDRALSGIKNAHVDSFKGLVTDYCIENGIGVIIRGLRNSEDFEYELPMAYINRDLSSDRLETLYLNASPEFSYVSSSAVKEIASFKGDFSAYVPDFLVEEIKAKYN